MGDLSVVEEGIEDFAKEVAPWALLANMDGSGASSSEVFSAVTSTLSKAIHSFDEREKVLHERACELKRKLEEATKRADEVDRRLGDMLDSHEDKFSSAQESRGGKFKEELDEARENLLSREKELNADSSRIVDELSKVKSRGAELLAEVEELSGSVTSSLLARDYGAYSNRDFWSGIAAYVAGIAAIVIGAVFLFSSLGEISPAHAPSWQWLLLKVSIGALVAGVAAVLFRLGGRLLENSAETKRRELELRSIVPFLEGVD